jgi:competence protein ComEA
MRGLFLCTVGILSACQSNVSVEYLNLDEKVDIEVSVVDLEQNISTHKVLLHAPLSDLLAEIECDQCDFRVFNANMKLKQGDVIVLQAYVEHRISINTADIDELVKLTHVGPVLAQRIIEYRNQYGFFQTLEEIMLVRGIKQGIYQKIKAFIRL